MTYPFPDSVLIIFCKAPIPGQVKTRLQPELTAEQAAAAHEQLTLMTLERACQSDLCPVQLYCAPDTQHAFFQACATRYSVNLAEQRGDDLGLRMLNAFSDALSHYQHALLMGSDCPSLTIADLQQALVALHNGNDVVLAPAEDGGYVLVGMNTPQASLFENMTWGNFQVMAETRRRASAAHLVWHELVQQWDVDRPADWQRYLSGPKSDAAASSLIG